MFQFQNFQTEAHTHHRANNFQCSSCEPGWGAIQRCTRNHDTLCSKCKPGTYNPRSGTRACWICSRCGPGLYIVHPCTDINDTVCDSCRRPAPQNSDYKKKCADQISIFLAPEDALATDEESSLVNEDGIQNQEQEMILREDAEAQIIKDNTRHSKLAK